MLERVNAEVRKRYYSPRTEQSYAGWIKRFILCHGKCHSRGVEAAKIEAFLGNLAANRNVSTNTQNHALAAVLFLYRDVMGIDLPWLNGMVAAERGRRLLVVLTQHRTRALLHELNGTMWLVTILLYGLGRSLLEGSRPRRRDVEFERRERLQTSIG